MTTNQLASDAVYISNAFKGAKVPQDVYNYLLSNSATLTTNDIIEYFVRYGAERGFKQLDVDDIVQYEINTREELVTELEVNSYHQNLAQDMFYIINVVKGFLPPKWNQVITIVLNTYLAIKGGAK